MFSEFPTDIKLRSEIRKQILKKEVKLHFIMKEHHPAGMISDSLTDERKGIKPEKYKM